MRPFAICTLWLSAVFSSAASVGAQCVLQWAADSGGGLRVVPLPSGDVVVSGFDFAARFDGTIWRPMGSVVGTIDDFAELPNGELVAVGQITMADQQPVPGIALWDGAAWHALPAPLGPQQPAHQFHMRQVVVLPSGYIAVAGIFSPNPSAYTTYVVTFDGATWQTIGTALGTTGRSPDTVCRGSLEVPFNPPGPGYITCENVACADDCDSPVWVASEEKKACACE